MNYTHFLNVFFVGVLLWLSVNSQFVKQPGDVSLTAIPGYPLSGYIPCTLDTSKPRRVGWEQKTKNGKPRSISEGQSVHLSYEGTYIFLGGDPLDYSISMKRVPLYEPQLRCYVMDEDSPVRYSSWSNIAYIAPPGEQFPVCAVKSDGKHITEGDNILLTCKSEGGVPFATLRLFNGTSRELLNNGDQGNHIVLNITVSKYDNATQFYCTAENEATRMLAKFPNCSVDLEVNYKPYITQFASDSLSVENNSTVWCEVDGNPVSVITMFNISDESSHLSMVPGGTNVKHKIIGSTLNCRAKVELKCLAENGIGVAEENIAMTVGCRPKVVNEGTIIYARERSGHFWEERNVIAYPKPNVTCYSFYPNGLSTEMNRGGYFLRDDAVQATTSLRLLLEGEHHTNSGRYLCVMANSIGSTDVEFRVLTNIERSTKVINSTNIKDLVTEMQEDSGKVELVLDINVIIGIGTVISVLLVCIALFAFVRNCHLRYKRRLRVALQTVAVEETELNYVNDEVATTSPVEELITNPPTPTIESDTGSSYSTSIPYDMPHPQYINQHMEKPVYSNLKPRSEEGRTSSQELDYEEIENAEYETPV